MNRISQISIATAFLAAALPVDVAAQGLDSVGDQRTDFYVETRDGDDVFDPRAPTGFVSDVGLEDLTGSGEDLGDALDRAPGLFVLRRSSLGQPAYASLRGGNPRQLSISISGIELSIPAGLGFDVGGASVLGIERARVFRGAAGVHRGAGALTGAIELVPRLRLEPGHHLTFSTMAGSFGTLATSATIAIDSKWASIALGAERRRSRGDFEFEDDGQQFRRVNNDHERIAVFGNTAIDVTNITTLETVARFETTERGTPGPSEFQNALQQARTDESRAVGTIRFDHKGLFSSRSFGTLDLYEAFGGQWRRERYQNDQTAIGSGELLVRSEYTSGTAKTGFLHWIDYRGVPLSNAFRFDYSYRYEEYRSTEEGVFESDIDVFRKNHGVSFAEELIFQSDYSALAGLRHESVLGERDESAWLPFVGLSASPLDWLRFQANLARTYRPPDFDELYLNSEILRGDPDLDSERSTAFDVGARARTEQASLELVFFQNSVENPIRFLPVNVYLTRAMNLEDYVARGAEIAGTYQPFARVAIEGGYTMTFASLSEVDAQAPAVPRHTGRLSSRVELAGWIPWVERARLGVDARYRGAMNLDLLGTRTSPAWVDLGASILVSPLEWLDLRVTAHNLLDRRDVIDVLQQPLPGRALYLAVTITTEQP